MSEPAGELLRVDGLTKCYGAVTVLDDCSVSFRAGEIHALLGANGAGKSTLVRMLAGLLAPSLGTMTMDGAPYAPRHKRDAESFGVEIIQQELNLIPTLSVAENLFLTRLPSSAGVIRKRHLVRSARQALDRFGLEQVGTETQLGALGVGQQQIVEIAAALDRSCRLLILDEPTAALSAAESERLFTWLKKLRNEGVGIVYISHRLDEVKRLAERITVLRDGHVVGSYDAQDCSTDRIVELMSGESASQQVHDHQSRVTGEQLLRVERLCGGIVKDASFELHVGERLGIAGLVGSGRTELLRLIFGADKAESGRLLLQSDPLPRKFSHPSEAVSAGLAMVTEDRKVNGLLLKQGIRFNTTLASLWERFSRIGMAKPRAEIAATEKQCKSLEVRCRGIDQVVGTLSGGNQQKIAIAKWLVRDADVFLFDEPTRGIDVAARRRIYRLIDSLAERGKGMVIASSDTEELLEICDRIIVMSNGLLVETFARGNWSEESIMQAAFAGYLDQEAKA